MTKITIGARGSKLSLAYVAKVKELLIKNNNELKEENIDFKAIKTSGDLHLSKKISDIGGKNLFCKEIEDSLIKKQIDIAVHSLKDMDSSENQKLVIGAYIRRNDFRDVLISERIKSIDDLKDGIKIGSSSRRRELQLKKINNKISIMNIRGNIDTRINKMSKSNLDGIILAAAGVKSLKLDDKIGFTFETESLLPAVGQGIIAVQCRKEDKIKNMLKKINDGDRFVSDGLDSTRGIFNNYSLQFRYFKSQAGNLNMKLSYVQVKYNTALNTPIAFAVLEGLQPGKNFVWGVGVDRLYKSNLQLNLSYDGRKSETGPIVHIGSMTLRYLF